MPLDRSVKTKPVSGRHAKVHQHVSPHVTVLRVKTAIKVHASGFSLLCIVVAKLDVPQVRLVLQNKTSRALVLELNVHLHVIVNSKVSHA